MITYILTMLLTISGLQPEVKTAEFATFEGCKVAAIEWLESLKQINAEWRAHVACSAKGDDV